MKYDYKKQEKELYGVKANPQKVDVPIQTFICIKGIGNPNSEMFAKHIEVLYQLSYTIKMMPKNGFTPKEYFDYVVYPLEGLWSLTEKGIQVKRQKNILDKNELIYTLMIKQPSFVDRSVFEIALEMATKKKANPLLKEVYYDELIEGPSIQILHIGSYDTEPESFIKIDQYMKDNNYRRESFDHKEIYLSDARKVEPNKLKTILRVRIER